MMSYHIVSYDIYHAMHTISLCGTVPYHTCITHVYMVVVVVMMMMLTSIDNDDNIDNNDDGDNDDRNDDCDDGSEGDGDSNGDCFVQKNVYKITWKSFPEFIDNCLYTHWFPWLPETLKTLL